MINNLTINIHADDQLRSTNINNNTIKIQSNSLQMLYPKISDKKMIPSVPVCHQQGLTNENVDRKIQAIFE